MLAMVLVLSSHRPSQNKPAKMSAKREHSKYLSSPTTHMTIFTQEHNKKSKQRVHGVEHTSSMLNSAISSVKL
jgi:hypothetical protein